MREEDQEREDEGREDQEDQKRRRRRQDAGGSESRANDSHDRYLTPSWCSRSESGQGDGHGEDGSGRSRTTSITVRGDGGGTGTTPATYEDYVAAALEMMAKAGAVGSARGDFERNVAHYQNRFGGHHSVVSSISTAPTDVDKVLRNLIVQCLVRNNREGGGGGVTHGSGCAGSETDSRPSPPSTLGRDPSTSLLPYGADPSMVSPTRPRRSVISLPGGDNICQKHPPMLSRDPSMTSSPRSSGGGAVRATSMRGAGINGREDPPESGQLHPQMQRTQRRQPPRPDLVRYHHHGSSSSNKSKIHPDDEKHTEQEKLSPRSSDMLTRRGQHHKRILLESMASSAAQSPPSSSSPMAPPSSSAMMASNSSVRNHPPGGVSPHRQHMQRPQQPRQRQVVSRPEIFHKPNRFIPTTSITLAPSSTAPTNTDRLDNPDITQRRQMHQLRLQEQGGGVGAVSRVLTEQSEERRRRYKEILLRQTQQQLLLLQRQQQQHHHHQQHPQHQQAAVNKKSSFSVAD